MAGQWKDAIAIVTRILIGLIIIPFLIVLYSVCWIRVKLTALIYSYKSQSILSRADVVPMSNFEHVENIMNGVTLLKGHLSLDGMKELFLSKVLNAKDTYNRPRFPRFTRYAHVCAGYQMWSEETNFNVDDHIRLYHGQPPNDEEQLKMLVTDLCHIPLHPLKSGWEIIVIPLEYSQSDVTQTCILSRLHHCMADGISMFRLIIEQMAGDHGAFRHVLKQSQNKFKPKIENEFVNMLVNVARISYRLVFKPSFILPKSINNVFLKDQSRDCQLSESAYIDWTSGIKLDTIRHIKNATSTTVTDVLTSCVAGAFRKYFVRHGICPPDFLATGIPITAQDPDDPVEMINKLNALQMQMPMGEMDCLQRLKAITVEMDQLKCSTDIIISRWVQQYWFNTIPYKTVARMYSSINSNVSISNMFGPTNKASINGNTIESIVGIMCPNRQTGFALDIISYAGEVTVGVSVDKARVSGRDDVRQLLDDLVEEVQQLYNTVVTSPNKTTTAIEKKTD